MTVPSLIAKPEKMQPALQVTPEQSGDFLGITSRLEATRNPDEAGRPLFTWPVQVTSPLMVSTATRPDLLD
jgi:hypothetical protein